MSGSNTVATQSSQNKSLSQSQAQNQLGKREQEHTYEAKGSAQAGLNLNIFAALSGIFSSKSKKTTDTAADGSARSVEHVDSDGSWKGTGHGVLNAVGRADGETRERHLIREEAGRSDTKSVEGKDDTALVEEGVRK